ncbi:iron-containing redox enzyme family protein [Demequina aestuarii]|uniref:iron-containing redox enzyme family protein n=1 Tax=Demequina aestuarii TaxID=327095 RepID=UPI000784F498|nr:iron-containing redox enzyme family protein [Demequina aestuarii]
MAVTVAAPSAVRLPFTERGPVSDAVMRHLSGSTEHVDHTELAQRAVARTPDACRDEDLALALFTLYASSYGSIDPLAPDLEWDPHLIATRQVLEHSLEEALRAAVPAPALPTAEKGAVARALFSLTKPSPGPSLSRHVATRATAIQAKELLVQRSVYTLREADPHSWAIPRLHGRAKAALVEIQADEYGGGRVEHMHSAMFATAMRGMGLDDAYGAYVDAVPALTLTSHNMMSMFGINRRLIGAIVGHLAAFEMTSSIPSRMYADGLRRLGFGTDVTDYFDVHVEADAVHEQIAGRDLAGALAEDSPEALSDIMFGAAACMAVDAWVDEHILDAWSRGESSLRTGALL